MSTGYGGPDRPVNDCGDTDYQQQYSNDSNGNGDGSSSYQPNDSYNPSSDSAGCLILVAFLGTTLAILSAVLVILHFI